MKGMDAISEMRNAKLSLTNTSYTINAGLDELERTLLTARTNRRILIFLSFILGIIAGYLVRGYFG